MSQVRDALAASMSGISGLRVSAFMPDAPRPPVVIVMPQRIAFDLDARRGADSFYIRLMLIVSRADDRSSQAQLDGFISSIKAAVESDRTLGGEVDTCRVTTLDNYAYVPVGDTIYLGADFTVEVIA